MLPACDTHVLVYSLRAGAKRGGRERKAYKRKGNPLRYPPHLFFLSVQPLPTAGAQAISNSCSMLVLFLGARPWT